MTTRKLNGDDRRGLKQDRAARPALIKRAQRRRAIELAQELEQLIKEITS